MVSVGHVRANGFDFFGGHKDLVKHVIVDVGDIEKSSSSTASGTEILKMNGRCFQPHGGSGFWSYGKKAGLLMFDSYRNSKLAVLEAGLGSIKVDIKAVSIIECSGDNPSKDFEQVRRDADKSIRDAEEQLRQLEKQNLDLKRQYEQLRRQRDKSRN